MPTGDIKIIPEVIELLMKIEPKTILDIGPGFGKWGVLMREYLEVYNNLRFDKYDWEVTIDAIEANVVYNNAIKNICYNTIIYRDARFIISKWDKRLLEEYDCVLLLDVIEHFKKFEGIQILRKLKERTKYIIIVTPSRLSQLKSRWNEYEDHKCVWSVKEFEEMGFKSKKLSHGPILAVWQSKT
jgi:2-polyprenyl-3-methyl-5-hydroxy-6-metoxy-1,4-benzoquinol methylase